MIVTLVDWPVTMLFYNNPTKRKVRNNIYWGAPLIADNMNFGLRDEGVNTIYNSDY